MAREASVGAGTLFREEQRPSLPLVQKLRWASLGGGALLLAWLLSQPQGLWWAIPVVLGVGAYQWWLGATRFQVQLSTESLELQWGPWGRRSVAREDILDATPHMSYPWGYRDGGRLRATPGVEAFATGPGAGVVLELAGGQALWLNSGRAEELAACLRPRRRRSVRRVAAASVS